MEEYLQDGPQGRQMRNITSDTIVKVGTEFTTLNLRQRSRLWHTKRKKCAAKRYHNAFKACSWMTRSNWVCNASDNSPISSRNGCHRLPARKHHPRGRRTGKGTRSWPKNSLPDSSGTMVVQSRTTRSPLSGRGSSVWIGCSNSLLVPLPRIKTEASNAPPLPLDAGSPSKLGFLPPVHAVPRVNAPCDRPPPSVGYGK